LRMYVRSAEATDTPAEETLDSPLSILGLISDVPGAKTFESRPARRDGLPAHILGFAILELLEALDARQVPIEDLMRGCAELPAIGAVFRLTEASLLAKIEQLVRDLPDLFALRETAGIHQLYLLGRPSPTDILAAHYSDTFEEAAA
jgi:hypothetical protein